MKFWTLVIVLSLVAITSAQPNGDYGDAPDGTETYWAMGRFPTLYDSSSGKMGGHTLVTGEEMIGTMVSAEDDADDLSDPDGTPNLVDKDLDDPIYISVVAVAIPAPAKISFPVTIDDSAPRGQRYINVLVDFDRNGSWGGDDYGVEWVVQNEPVDTAPGTTEMFTSDWFNWGGGMTMPSLVWGRAAITRSPISVADWKGDGEFQYGEIQDFIVDFNGRGNITKRNITKNKTKPVCGNNVKEFGEQCDGRDAAACPGKCRADCTCPKGGGGGGKKEGPVEPGPREGPCTTPVAYHALVINAGDNSKRRQGQDSADDIWSLLGQQGYDRGQYLAPHWDKEIGEMTDNGITQGGYSSLADIEAAFADLGKNIKCVDRVMIYIIGHGLKKGGKKYGKTWANGGIILQGKDGGKEVLTPEKLKELLDKYLPACPGEDCKTPEKSCHVSVVVESCHSGNFFDFIKGEGRTVAVSSASNEVAFFGKNKEGEWHGGDYTNGYVKDMKSPGTADTDKDGFVSVAEAHASANAKLSVANKYGKKQTPSIDSQECECLPLVCGPKCGDGIINGNEECDYNATPTGCLDNQECSKECYCEYIETPPENYCGNTVVDAGEECDPTAFPNGCASGLDCIDCECIGDDIITDCPKDRYTEEDCEAKRQSHQRCVYDEANGCWYLQSLCQRDEYLSSTCEGDCDESGLDCIIADQDVPCYICGEAEACDSDEYETQSDCESDCNGDCLVDEASDCWYCEIDEADLTCQDRDMFDSQSACNSACDSPSYCAFHEGYDCWYCQGVSCGQGLYDSSNCDNNCDSGEVCESYQGSGCYYCNDVPCPDLYVSYIYAYVSRHASTTCQGEYCTTDCTADGYIEFKIRNAGSGTAGASSAVSELSPGMGSQSESIGSLSSGQETGQYHHDFNQAATVQGSGLAACSELAWWSESYTATVNADSGGAVSECDESNNENSATPSS